MNNLLNGFFGVLLMLLGLAIPVSAQAVDPRSMNWSDLGPIRQRGDEIYVPTGPSNRRTEFIQSHLDWGYKVCIGDPVKRRGQNQIRECAVKNPHTGVIIGSPLIRDVGLSKNAGGMVRTPTDSSGRPVLGPAGQPLESAFIGMTDNGAVARKDAALIGLSKAADAGTLSLMGCGRNCGGGGAVAISNSFSDAAAAAAANASMTGQCPSGSTSCKP